jgi:hypothetical protein
MATGSWKAQGAPCVLPLQPGRPLAKHTYHGRFFRISAV